jgi:hypothetical protein
MALQQRITKIMRRDSCRLAILTILVGIVSHVTCHEIAGEIG